MTDNPNATPAELPALPTREEIARLLCDASEPRRIAEQEDAPPFTESASHVQEYWLSLADEVAALHPPASVAEVEGWQPIETAPKDGRALWLHWPQRCPEDRQAVGWWESDLPDGARWMDHADACDSDAPSHWRPLPAPPAMPSGEKG